MPSAWEEEARASASAQCQYVSDIQTESAAQIEAAEARAEEAARSAYITRASSAFRDVVSHRQVRDLVEDANWAEVPSSLPSLAISLICLAMPCKPSRGLGCLWASRSLPPSLSLSPPCRHGWAPARADSLPRTQREVAASAQR